MFSNLDINATSSLRAPVSCSNFIEVPKFLFKSTTVLFKFSELRKASPVDWANLIIALLESSASLYVKFILLAVSPNLLSNSKAALIANPIVLLIRFIGLSIPSKGEFILSKDPPILFSTSRPLAFLAALSRPFSKFPILPSISFKTSLACS